MHLISEFLIASSMHTAESIRRASWNLPFLMLVFWVRNTNATYSLKNAIFIFFQLIYIIYFDFGTWI